MLGIVDPALRAHLHARLSDVLGRDECLLASPLFEHTFGWEESSQPLSALTGDLLSSSMIETLCSAHAYRFESTQHPYVHQVEAWRTLTKPTPHSAVITSGTGSGKTECFLVPILDDLIQEYDREKTPLIGVRALFLYPLNALINSQQERLDAWTRRFEAGLRFCLYNGNTEETAAKVRRLQGERPNQILSRELLRREPSPILMTNSTMLEYMLVRQVDEPIIQTSREQQSLRWIVLDEAHTYVGSQAAELSLLLRRVVDAFGRKSEDIRFIATSATIAASDAHNRLQRYLADLAGVPIDRVSVIGGRRALPPRESSTPASRISLSDVAYLDKGTLVSKKRFATLSSAEVSRRLRDTILESPRPSALDELVRSVASFLGARDPAAQQREVIDWLDLMATTAADAESEPFIRLRAHLFQRMMHGLWACVDPLCNQKTDDLREWPFGAVYTQHRQRCNCGAPVFELAFCRECATPYLIADEGPVLQQRMQETNDEFALLDGSDAEEAEDQDAQPLLQARNEPVVLAGSKGEPYFEVTLDLETARLAALRAQRSCAIHRANETEALCLSCGYGPKPEGFLRRAHLGAPFYVSNVVPTALEFCPDADPRETAGRSPEQLPAHGRRLITFTDSRQGTARMAVRMQQDAERSKLRGLVFETLRNAQHRANAAARTPTETPEQLRELIEFAKQRGMADLMDDAQRKLTQLSQGSASSPPATIPWEEMITALCADRDISGSILTYNRYANPELFREGGETSVARLLLTREFARRPKNQTSTETLGLVKVGYKGLLGITSVPPAWTDTQVLVTDGVRRRLALPDWHDFLKVALDFYVRENSFVRVDPAMQRWMGARIRPKLLYPPSADIVEDNRTKRWPQVSRGQPSRLIKLLEAGVGLDRQNPADRDKINLWLRHAWSALVGSHILEPAESGYALNFATLEFSLPQEAWVCPITNRLLDTTFVGLTPYLPTARAKSYACRKTALPKLEAMSPDGSAEPTIVQVRRKVAGDPIVATLRTENLWTDLSDRTVEGGAYYRSAEHSAQQSAPRLKHYEDAFKRGDINVLNCSTTMEMGVDIGGISAIVMNNVPPHPANYLQRAGRAGRRKESRSLAYTLCKGDSHNRRAFENPEWPFITTIPAPIVALSSARIVQRHVNSLLLAAFLRQLGDTDTDRTRLTVGWFFGGDHPPSERFAAWLDQPDDELEDRIRTLVRGTAIGERIPATISSETANAVRLLEEDWKTENAKLTTLLAETPESPYRRALQMEHSRHVNEYLLRELAAKAFLPGYGFPTDVVGLRTYNIEDFRHSQPKDRPSREDNIYALKEQPTRGLDVAIREYAPGAQVVIDGRVYRSAGVSLQWHASGQTSEAQRFDLAWHCSHCGASGLEVNAYANSAGLRCDQCQSEISENRKRLVLRPAGFVTDFYEPTSNDVSTQKFIPIERPRVAANGETVALPDPRCGHIRFGHSGSVFHCSAGEHERGFAVCMRCGRSESMAPSGDLPFALRPGTSHRPLTGVGRNIEQCDGNAVKPSVFLGYALRTDVLEIALRNPESGEWLSQSEGRSIAMTIAVALREALAERQGIAATEMGCSVRSDRDTEAGATRSVIQLFDNASGGAGFVLNGAENIDGLLRNLPKYLECPDNCDAACTSCLLQRDIRFEDNLLNRHHALAWLRASRLLDHLVLPSPFADIPGASYCAIDPLSWVRATLNKQGDTITILLAGDAEAWDLGHQRFRDRVLSWAFTEKLNVVLALPGELRLSETVKAELALLGRLGVAIAEQKGSPPGCVALQVSGKNTCATLFSTSDDALVPGEEWLRSRASDVWASSEVVKAISTAPLDTSSWTPTKSRPGTVLIDVTTEFNGRLANLPERVASWIKKNDPELAQRRAADAVVSIEYSDRYLRSPWSLLVLTTIMKPFASDRLQAISLSTVDGQETKLPRQLKQDWGSRSDFERVAKRWMKAELGVSPSLRVFERSYELQHRRVMRLGWASGEYTTILFDQGMGYWVPQSHVRQNLDFDFRQNPDEQANELKRRVESLSIVNCGPWPTSIVVKST
jgi:hypothetical protein